MAGLDELLLEFERKEPKAETLEDILSTPSPERPREVPRTPERQPSLDALLKSLVAEKEEGARPNLGGVVDVPFGRTRAAARSALELTAKGTKAMFMLPGLRTLGPAIGIEPEQILPEVPKGLPKPLRAFMAAGRTLVDPLVGFGASVLSVPAFIFSPFAETTERLKEKGEEEFGVPGRIAGTAIGTGLEALATFGVGAALTKTSSLAAQAAGRLIGPAPEKPPIYRVPAGRVLATIEEKEALNALGHALIPNYKRDANFISMASEMKGRKVLANIFRDKVFKDLGSTAKTLARNLGKDLDDVRIEMGQALKGESVNPGIMVAVRPIRDRINTLQRELAEKGLVDPGVVEKSIDIYLTRSYLSKLLPEQWYGSKEMLETVPAARDWLRKNYRIAVEAEDPLRAAESLALEEGLTSLRRAFRQTLRETPRKGEVRFSEQVVSNLRKEVLGTVKEDISGVVDALTQKPTFREIFKLRLVKRGMSEDLADIAMDVISKGGPKAFTMGRRLSAPEAERIAATVGYTRKLDIPRVQEAIEAAKELVGEVKGNFDAIAQRLKSTKTQALTVTEVRKMETEFKAGLEAIRGKGPVSFRNATNDEVEGLIEHIGKGGEKNIHVLGRGGETARIFLGFTKKRKDIPEPIRKLMGEVEDGPAAAAITINNLHRSLILHDFLE